MSISLLKRSLELFKDDIEDNGPKKKKMKDPKNLIGTNKTGVKKQRRKVAQVQNADGISKRKKYTRTVHDEIDKYKKVDHTEVNVEFLSRLSQLDTATPSTVEKILESHKGKLAKNHRIQDGKSEKSSVFSDKDFAKFEKEYNWGT